jgi:putative peptide zinc metalloprotease protein
VNNANTAIAYASCSNCTTVAIAIQIVFVVGSPSVFTPQNVAIAVNENCHACNTLAMAYQLVVQVSGPVRLTPEGLRQLRDIRSQLQALRELSMTIAQMHDKVLALEQQLQQVMTTQLVRVKGDEQHGAQGDNPSSTSTTSTTFGATTNGSLSTTTAPVRTTSTSTSTTTTTTTSSTSTTSSSTTATSKP